MKKVLSLLLALTLLLGLSSLAAAEEVKLVVSLTAVSTDTHAMAMQEFKKTVEELSSGSIKVELYTDAVLFNQEEEVVAVAGGDADMSLVSASWLTTGSPWIGMFTAGYVFKSYDHMTKVLNGDIGKQVFERVGKEQNVLPLAAWYLGSRQISLSQDKEIKTPEDLKGINLRMPNSEAWLLLGKALGANPTPISFSELYLALQTGVVDGQDNPLPTVESAKFYEVQKSITITNHLVDSVWPCINLDKWNSLTAEQQDILLKGVEAGRKYCDENNLAREAKLVEFFKEKGLQVYNADLDAFANHVLDVYMADDFSNAWDTELLDQVRALGE
jgi:tripartite ATP-independent transporter DctP family solute receptor